MIDLLRFGLLTGAALPLPDVCHRHCDAYDRPLTASDA